jgi:hypothetical protein
MNLFNTIVLAYFLAIFVLIHCSLLFCSEEHCMYPLVRPPISREAAYYIRSGISNLMPISFKLIQQIGQWFILIEALLLAYFALKAINYIVSLFFKSLLLAVFIGLAYYTYNEYQSNPEKVMLYYNLLIDKGAVLASDLWQWL